MTESEPDTGQKEMIPTSKKSAAQKCKMENHFDRDGEESVG